MEKQTKQFPYMHGVNPILKIIRQVKLSARTKNKANIILCTHFIIFDIQIINSNTNNLYPRGNKEKKNKLANKSKLLTFQGNYFSIMLSA